MIKLNILLNSKLILRKDGKVSISRLYLSIDTRNIANKNFFICLKGANYNSSQFISSFIKDQKIKVVAYNLSDFDCIKSFIDKYSDILFIGCADTIEFMQDLARLNVEHWKKSQNGQVIAITGSNGKTTTKDYLSQCLRFLVNKKKVLSSLKSFNNHIGVPLTVLDLMPYHKYLILEFGSNHPGEIAFLSTLISPAFAIITSIGESHLEFFKTKQNVYLEKINIFKFSGVMYEDDILSSKTLDLNIVVAKKSEKISEISDSKFIKEPYNQENLYLCYELLNLMFPSRIKKLKKIITKIKNVSNLRSSWVTIKDSLIYVDTYNANPTSMQASLKYFMSLDLFKQHSKDCLFVIGDMNELGEARDNSYSLICNLLKTRHAENVVFVGSFSSLYKQYFSKAIDVFLDVEDVKDKIYIYNYKYIFLKGSRTIQLENLLLV